MALRALVHTSLAHADLEPCGLDRLLQQAAAFNRLAGVTGVLVFDGQRFVQYLEGPGDGMDAVAARICNARSHHGVELLAQAPLPARRFARWAMASRRIDTATCQRLWRTDWNGLQAGAPGVALLRGLWTGRSGELEPAAVCLGS